MQFLNYKDIFSNKLFDNNQRKLYLGFLLYIAVFVLFYLGLYFFDIYSVLPDNDNIIAWDAMWYHSIKTKGYEYYWYMASNSAFFPLFSYVWRLLHFSNIGISIFNFSLFIVSISILYRTFSISLPKILLYISFPTGIFFFLPYSESFFFFFTSLFLIGLYKNNSKLIFLGLLLSSLTRATAMFFLPAIIIMEILNSTKFLDKAALKNILLYSLASLLGLLIVVLFQYAETNTWFAFAKQQVRFWRHHLLIPTFPLVSHGGEKSLWTDGFAFFVGISASLILIVTCIKKVFLNRKAEFTSNRALWFSGSYILMVTVYTLFFNSKCLQAQTTIDSMNRYIFSTSFFFVFFTLTLNYFSFNLKNYFIFFGILLGALFLIGFTGDSLFFLNQQKFGKNGSLIFFILLFLYINLHYFSGMPKYGKYISLCLFSLNIFLATYLLHNFISGAWAG